VYVSVDKKTNQIVNQYPEDSRLRTRAYLADDAASRTPNRMNGASRPTAGPERPGRAALSIALGVGGVE